MKAKNSAPESSLANKKKNTNNNFNIILHTLYLLILICLRYFCQGGV